jgi:hypothetical protein
MTTMADFRDKGNSGSTGEKPQQAGQASGARQTTTGQSNDPMQQARNVASNVADQVRDTAQGAMHAASDFAGQARERVQDWMSGSGDFARQAGNRLQGIAGEAFDYSSDHLRDFGSELTGMVRRYPLAAVLAGFAVGVLIGRSARS